MSLDFLRKPGDTIRIGGNGKKEPEKDKDNAEVAEEDDAWDDRELIKAYDETIKGFRKTKKKLKKGKHPELTEAPVIGPWVPVNHDLEDYNHGQPLYVAAAGEQVFLEESADADNAVEAGVYEGVGENEDYDDEYENELEPEEPDSEDAEAEVAEEQIPSTSRRQPDLMPQFQLPNIFMPPIPSSSLGQDFDKGTLPSLLRSWYMAGYHAGYFDAKQELKRQHKERKHNRKHD